MSRRVLCILFTCIGAFGVPSTSAASIDAGGEGAADWSCDLTIATLCLAAAAIAVEKCVTGEARTDATGPAGATTEITVCGSVAAGGDAAQAHTIPAEMTTRGAAGSTAATPQEETNERTWVNTPGQINGCSAQATGGSGKCVSGKRQATGTNPVTSAPQSV